MFKSAIISAVLIAAGQSLNLKALTQEAIAAQTKDDFNQSIVDNLFKAADTGLDGSIDAAEWEAHVNSKNGGTTPKEDMDAEMQAFKDADANNDGKVTQPEALAFLASGDAEDSEWDNDEEEW